jgi:hypothetical protein
MIEKGEKRAREEEEVVLIAAIGAGKDSSSYSSKDVRERDVCSNSAETAAKAAKNADVAKERGNSVYVAGVVRPRLLRRVPRVLQVHHRLLAHRQRRHQALRRLPKSTSVKRKKLQILLLRHHLRRRLHRLAIQATHHVVVLRQIQVLLIVTESNVFDDFNFFFLYANKKIFNEELFSQGSFFNPFYFV